MALHQPHTVPARKVMLVSIDGWGLTDEVKGNALKEAKIPCMTKLTQSSLYATLDASGNSVGLPKGVMGNSEVGHLTMGVGRVSWQSLARINAAIEDNEFDTNPELVKAFQRAKQASGRVHFLGLVSDGSVHSHIDHLKAFIKAAKAAQIPEAFVQFFADGRDTPPNSGTTYVQQLQSFLDEQKYGSIATVIGRYYAMDRDKRWERVHLAYEALVAGAGEKTDSKNLIQTIQQRYARQELDEFLKPIIVNEQGLIKNGDTLVFIDFRADRMREIVQVFGIKAPFEGSFTPVPSNLQVVQMTEYDASYPLPVLYPPVPNDNCLAEWLSKHKIPQFHTAETEKYAHVTFFFNGGREEAFELEDRLLVPSPKVATYDLTPAMSMDGVADAIQTAIESGKYPFVMCNLAPPDMVGHTGKYKATVAACEATDKVIERIWNACQAHGYVLVITADHGNCEEMLDEHGNEKTSHTTNPVPLIVIGDDHFMKGFKVARSFGGLRDVAPTVLHIMGLSIPTEMTGTSMLIDAGSR